MNFFEKLGKLLVQNMAYTIPLVIALVFFVYFTEGHVIDGVIIAVSALVVYVTIVALYQEYKKMYAPKAAPVASKPAAAKKPAKKKATKKK